VLQPLVEGGLPPPAGYRPEPGTGQSLMNSQE